MEERIPCISILIASLLLFPFEEKLKTGSTIGGLFPFTDRHYGDSHYAVLFKSLHAENPK